MKKNCKIAIASVMLVIMVSLCIIPASANSRAQEWYGKDANGVIILGDDVPIQVTDELLTFDIPTIPYATYNDAESFIAYNSKVTAEYTFYNPTDMTVTATLLFPFGSFPEYGRYIDYDKFDVKVNGEEIDKTIRYTCNTSYSGKYNIEEEIKKISDEYVKDDFYSPDLAVTKYTYKVYGLTQEQIDLAKRNKESIEFHVCYSGRTENMVIYAGGLHKYSTSGEDRKPIYNICESIDEVDQEIIIYTIGRPFDESEISDPKIYSDPLYTSEASTKLDVTLETKTEEMTFESFALSNYDAERGISKVDWYNAVVTDLYDADLDYSVDIITLGSFRNSFSGRSLDLWYQYEITLAPGESIKNSVTAPLYPVIDAWDRPITYDYTYYLSPASNWANFGDLNIIINTPYEMINSNIQGFEKTDSGYMLTRKGLPTDENGILDFYFTLENDGNTPLHQSKNNQNLQNNLNMNSTAKGSWLQNLWNGILLIVESIVNFFKRIFG